MLQKPHATGICTHAATALPAGDALAPRYAIYFAPHPASAWWKFGSAWLGRDAVRDIAVAPPRVASCDAAYLAGITGEPRRYGFHATLKAPFRLARGGTPGDVYLRAARLAATLHAVALPPLEPVELDDFVALSFAQGNARGVAVNAIAAQCVTAFDFLRAPATADELARRQPGRLNVRQAHLLAQWGYPQVFDEFRFHLTLTGRLPPRERGRIIETLCRLVEPLHTQPLRLDALTVYWQRRPEAPFLAMRRHGFDGSVDIYRHE